MRVSNSWHLCYLADAADIHTQRWAWHFAERGHRVTVISLNPFDLEGVNVVYIKPATRWPRLNYIVSALTVRRLIRQLQPDILHAHYATGHGLLGAIAGLHPFVVTAWGTDILISPEESFVYRRLVHWVLERADLVTSMARHMTTHLVERRYVAPDKVITLPFGVDTRQFHPGHRRRPHDGSPFLVVSTRRLDTIYDVQTLIRAAPSILSQLPDTRFVIAGDGPLRQELEALAAKLGVYERVAFSGHMPFEDMPRLVGEADVAVSTALSDGNNISLNEAMACGAFPVAADIPANREWINTEGNGLLFPPKDWQALARCVVQALRNPSMRNMAAIRNWEIVQQRASWLVNMARMEQQYYHLVTSKND